MLTNGSSALQPPYSDGETRPVPVPHLVPYAKAVEKHQAETELVCIECGKSYVEGAMMCLGCGLLFKPAAARDSVRNAGAPVYLEFDDGRITLPHASSVVLGRATEGIAGKALKQPDIDLSDLGALELGVSRQHARIVRNRNVLYIVDMGSTHGTYLNSTRLSSNHTVVLHSGDEIRLGSLTLRIRF